MRAPHTADCPVELWPNAAEVPPHQAACYDGIYTVCLNNSVWVVFVPDVSADGPPWDGRQLPDDLDLVDNTTQARVEAIMFAKYAVTPNAQLAGEVHAIGDISGLQRRRWVRYVTPAEFDQFAAELPRLYEVDLDHDAGFTVNGLREEFHLVRFLANEFVEAPWLDPADASLLAGATRATGTGLAHTP
jgi:hypothetical protein